MAAVAADCVTTDGDVVDAGDDVTDAAGPVQYDGRNELQKCTNQNKRWNRLGESNQSDWSAGSRDSNLSSALVNRR